MTRLKLALALVAASFGPAASANAATVQDMPSGRPAPAVEYRLHLKWGTAVQARGWTVVKPHFAPAGSYRLHLKWSQSLAATRWSVARP